MKPIENLKCAIDTMEIVLDLASGATQFQLRTAAYYAAATWFIPAFDKFPFLVLYGSTGVGKSALAEALGKFCYKPVLINIGGTTARALRNLFNEAHEATALLEEYEDTQLSGEIDSCLNARYSKQTQTMRKLKSAKNNWELEEFKTFGATIIHRRDHFKDQALENRCIWLHIVANTVRHRSDYQPMPESLVQTVVEDLQVAATISLPIEPHWPNDIAPRVAETYAPVLLLAQITGDDSYLAELNTHLQIADASFRDGQTYEPKALVVKGLLACLTRSNPRPGNDYLDLSKSVAITDICKHLQENYRTGLIPRQAAECLRELVFQLRQSGGKTKVMGITVPQLVKACQETGIEDELVAKAASSVP